MVKNNISFYTIKKICTISFLLCSLFLLLSLNQSEATEPRPLDEKIVYFFELNEDIMPAAERRVTRALAEAEEKNADIVLMRVNTYGGMVNVADSIRTMMLNARPTTVAWIKNNAASAGALISIACDSIYMSRGSNIGAATVVNQTGEQMPDKYQSYMRSMMRSTAMAKNRDPLIAEAMVDETVEIEGIIDAGKILTFTGEEALAAGFIEGKAESIEEVLSNMGIENYTLHRYETSFTESIINFLLNPLVNSILLLVIIGGLYFELQTPGVGFPIIASVVAATLYFGPLYIEGMAANWEILLFIVGILLIALEIFVIPGFGVAGVSGIIVTVTALTLALIQNDGLDFSFPGMENVAFAFFRVSITLLVSIGIIIFMGGNIANLRFFQKMILADVQDKNEGYTSADFSLRDLVGSQGLAVSDFRPSGKIEIGDEQYFAVSDAEWIKKGERIQVVSLKGSNLVVKKVK
ncbi:MAG: nodulation protein NfeD [Chitinophagaceae bacterium]|nr:MAG: nodulation protein NfeD [Chitinophagaceae bacterium]